MPATLVLAALLLAPPAADRFRLAHPEAELRLSPEGHVVQATNLRAHPAGAENDARARRFLLDEGAAFGVDPQDTLLLRAGVAEGTFGTVVYQRTFRGLPILASLVGLAFTDRGEIHSVVSAGPVPRAALDFRLDEVDARAAAEQRVSGGTVESLERGWLAEDGRLRPVFVVAIVGQRPYRARILHVDGVTGRVGFSLSALQYANGRVFRISPAKPFATTTPPTACATHVDSKGNVKHDACAPAEMVPLLGLKPGGTLTGDPAAHVGRTSVYNCHAGTTYDTTSCDQTMRADATTGDFVPVFTTDWGTSNDDPMSELMAYYHVDRHSRFIDSLDANFVGLPLVPGFTNANGPSPLTGNDGPMDNAFYDPAGKRMVFGQGGTIDFAYDGEVVYHEMTHAAVGAIGAQHGVALPLFAVAAPQGLLDEPLAINEGNADTFSFMEPGVNDPYLGEFTALDELAISAGVTVPIAPKGYIRDEGPDFWKTCQGDGKTLSRNPGRIGEAHEDGEIWAEFTYEVYQGLKPIGGIPTGATYDSPATPAMFHALETLIASPIPNQLFTPYASLLESQVRTMYGNKAGDYVKCVADRRALGSCDSQVVEIFSGETPFNDGLVKDAWKAFYYSYNDAYPGGVTPAGFDGVPAGIQWKLHVPASPAGLKMTVCDVTPGFLGPGGTGNLYLRYGKPVTYKITGTGPNTDWVYPPDSSWTVVYADCGSQLGGAPTVATLVGSTCDNCAVPQATDDQHPLAEGDWYFLVANTADKASFASVKIELSAPTVPTRPAPPAAFECTLDGRVYPDGGTVTPDGGSAGDAGPIPDGGGADGGVDPDGGFQCPPLQHFENGRCVDNCPTGQHIDGQRCVDDAKPAPKKSGCGCGVPASALGIVPVFAWRRRRR